MLCGAPVTYRLRMTVSESSGIPSSSRESSPAPPVPVLPAGRKRNPYPSSYVPHATTPNPPSLHSTPHGSKQPAIAMHMLDLRAHHAPYCQCPRSPSTERKRGHGKLPSGRSQREASRRCRSLLQAVRIALKTAPIRKYDRVAALEKVVQDGLCALALQFLEAVHLGHENNVLTNKESFIAVIARSCRL